MAAENPNKEISYELEAPGELLSGLLGVSEALLLDARAGSVRDLPGAYGSWRLIAPQGGRLRLTWGDRSWLLSEGQAAAFPGSEELSLFAAEDCTAALIVLKGSAADAVLRAEGGLFFERGGFALERILRVIAARRPRRVSAKEASELAYQLLMTLSGTGSDGPAGGQKLPGVVEAAIGIMRRDFAFLDGIAELAGRLEVSQEYLTRCFCRTIGVTPGRYLCRLRIENAKLLLREGRYSVQFVSDACGFTNGNYFARVFRSVVGVNPRDYARLHGGQGEESSRSDPLYVL